MANRSWATTASPSWATRSPCRFRKAMGGMIIGFDQGFTGMKIGGKRRIFIPWQLAYGTRRSRTMTPAHPGIPAKSDLIFDVELVEVNEMPPMQVRPPMGGMRPDARRPTPSRRSGSTAEYACSGSSSSCGNTQRLLRLRTRLQPPRLRQLRMHPLHRRPRRHLRQLRQLRRASSPQPK